MRRTLFAAVVAAFTVISIVPALAGGSWLDPSWERVEAGERIELSGFVSHGQLGWIEDGPFYTYLRGDEYGQVLDESSGGIKTDVPLGVLHAEPRARGVQVSTDFVLPTDIPPGEYWVLVCNEPCTTGLGDLIGGVIYVGIEPPSLEKEVTSIDTADVSLSATSLVVADNDPPTLARYLSLAPYPSRPEGLSPIWVGISAALAGAVLLAAVAIRQNSGRR